MVSQDLVHGQIFIPATSLRHQKILFFTLTLLQVLLIHADLQVNHLEVAWSWKNCEFYATRLHCLPFALRSHLFARSSPFHSIFRHSDPGKLVMLYLGISFSDQAKLSQWQHLVCSRCYFSTVFAADTTVVMAGKSGRWRIMCSLWGSAHVFPHLGWSLNNLRPWCWKFYEICQCSFQVCPRLVHSAANCFDGPSGNSYAVKFSIVNVIP